MDKIISLIYPEKLTIDEFGVRTPRLNEFLQQIYSLDKDFSENKNRTNENNSHLSCEVGTTRFELATPSTPC